MDSFYYCEKTFFFCAVTEQDRGKAEDKEETNNLTSTSCFLFFVNLTFRYYCEVYYNVMGSCVLNLQVYNVPN